MEKSGKVYILLSDSGGGHRTMAETIERIINERFPHLETEFIAVAEIWQKSRVYHLFSKNWVDTFFNKCPKSLISIAQRIGGYIIRHYLNALSKKAAKHLAPYWEQKKPTLVVSVFPLVNELLYNSLRAYNPKVPLLTVIADYGEMCKGAWIVKQNQYYICSTDNLYDTLLKLNIPKEKIMKTTGFLLPERFYRPHYEKKIDYRQELGLQESLPTIIIVFGAYGSRESYLIFKRLKRVETKLQLIFLTGKDRPIPWFLREKNTHHQIVTLPFTYEIEKYFAASDLLIGKPGPNVVSQAIAQRLPVIVNNSPFTMIQERYVAEFVEKEGVGIVVKNFNQIDYVIKELLETDQISRIQKNISLLNNNAYNETAKFIDHILETGH